ncbi:hypothetical protein IBG28_15505 [Marinomonas arctica]|uniref:DUF6708 domain-containing protein n=1 Tax=Marinomonas arctica TaxID=383750 RepID=A0A7H1J3L8_9GAMM|nr:DUF6708 domain-containing protein [Marinomonas arctica]QNT05084.1 hypothetical protein IBG28_15505 [Marinomonas arctica]GGN16238.1 hypothetical protein GCM10011350_01370 [Marinomonas arctica]
MSKIRQVEENLWVGPEDFGVTPHFKKTDHAIKHYPNGPALIHDPVQPGNIKIRFDFDDEPDDPDYTGDDSAKYLGEVFEGSSAGGHEGYVDMRVNSVTNRDGFFYMGLVCLFIWWAFDSFALSHMQNELFRQILTYSGYGLFFALSFGTLFRPVATPVRFHKQNQEVYVWHKKVLYRIPWDECEISICVAKQNEGYRGSQDGYQLNLWLNPKHAVNQDLTGQKHVSLNMMHNMNYHIPLYAYWEYVRRYMTGEEPLYVEMSKEARTPGFNKKVAAEKGYLRGILIFIPAIPIMLLVRPNFMALLTPFKAKWPKEVHEWTGERCDWH